MKITIGSPALTGVISSVLLADHFVSASFPLRALIINHMPRNFRHNDLNIHLKTCAGGVDTQAEVTVQGFSQLQKLCTEVEAISELNDFETGIEIHDLDAIEAADNAEKSAAASSELEKIAKETVKPEIATDPLVPESDKNAEPKQATAPLKITKKAKDNV
jgi:hypothetical protein